MRIEYTKPNWVRPKRDKRLPDLKHVVPFLLVPVDYALMYLSLRIAYETVGNVSFTAVYCAMGALVVSVAGIWTGLISLQRKAEKKWIPVISLMLHGLILLFVLIIIGLGI